MTYIRVHMNYDLSRYRFDTSNIE